MIEERHQSRAGGSEPDVRSLTITDASSLLRSRQLSAVELVDLVCDRIEATEPIVNAYASLDLDSARTAARAADAAGPAGPLHGIPFGVKDVFATAGVRTACGSAALRDNIPSDDALAVQQLRAAGAILLGKHVTHELTCGLDEPKTRNPWDRDYYPGGSSAGGGASVAVRSSLFALGTDAAGSVRIPAAATGVVGLKPTWSEISSTGVVRAATAPSIDHVGILAATISDLSLVLETLQPRFHGSYRDDVDGIRLGVLRADPRRGLESEVAAAFAEALGILEGLGIELVEVAPDGLGSAAEATATLFATELAEGNRELIAHRREAYHGAVRQLIEEGLACPTSEREAALRARERLRVGMAEAIASARLDALVTPTMPLSPRRLADLDPGTDLARIVQLTCPFNLTGQPALSVPCGLTAAGLPLGLQIAGKHWGENTIINIGRAFTAVAPGLPLEPAEVR
jgi:Asp-tRNA(Asn)/Glu-tRNA(Gln) amidotransferase A subunit family amidase